MRVSLNKKDTCTLLLIYYDMDRSGGVVVNKSLKQFCHFFYVAFRALFCRFVGFPLFTFDAIKKLLDFLDYHRGIMTTVILHRILKRDQIEGASFAVEDCYKTKGDILFLFSLFKFSLFARLKRQWHFFVRKILQEPTLVYLN